MADAQVTAPGARITRGPQSWQVLQRGADGRARVLLEGEWECAGPATVEVRAAREHDNTAVPGCDWREAETVGARRWRLALDVPTGGLYRIETRLRTPGTEWRLTGDKIWHIAVGDLWVIAGQSNAVGYGHGAVVDPPVLGVSVLGGNEQWRLATHPLFDPTGTKHPANRDSGWVDVSPWLTFGREILGATGVPVGLIPTALGGSPLRLWEPARGAEAHLWHNMVDFIMAAGGRVAGMVWYQGCSDTGEQESATYLDRFTGFVQAFREKYGEAVPVITAQLNRYLDNPPGAPNERWWSVVREAQRQAARRIPHLAVVPTLDLPLSDAIHTSAAGNVLLGQRFARAALHLAYGQAADGCAVDAETACFADAARHGIRIRFAPVTDHLVFLCLRPADFVVEDEAGVVPLASAQVEEPDTVVLGLARPAVGRTVCHHQVGTNPPSTLRDHTRQPVLAFYGLEVV